MDQQTKNTNYGRILIKVAWFIFIAGLLMFVWQLRNTLLSVIISVILAYIFLPYQKRLEKQMPKSLASILVIFTVILFLLIFIYFILPIFIEQISKLAAAMPSFIESLGTNTKFQEQLSLIGVNIDFKQILLDQISNLTSFIQSSAESIVTILSNVVNIITIIALIPFFMYYFLKDRTRFSRELMLLVPSKYRESTQLISFEVNVSLRAYIKGQIIISVLEGVLSIIGFSIIGLNYAFLLGTMLGLFNLIPYVGIIIGSLFALFVALITGVEHFIPALIVIVIVQQVQGLAAPKIVGNSIGMHPVYVLVIILVSGYLYGLVGMFFGIPVVMTLKIIFSHIYNKFVSPVDP